MRHRKNPKIRTVLLRRSRGNKGRREAMALSMPEKMKKCTGKSVPVEEPRKPVGS